MAVIERQTCLRKRMQEVQGCSVALTTLVQCNQLGISACTRQRPPALTQCRCIWSLHKAQQSAVSAISSIACTCTLGCRQLDDNRGEEG